MLNKAHIFWCTGLSGAGKTTLSAEAKKHLESLGFNVLVVDGDVVRSSYGSNPGFDREAIEKNNLNIAEICKKNRGDYDAILVPVISPIDSVRKEVKRTLSPYFSLIYLSAEVDCLKARDVKGLYAKADRGELLDMIAEGDRVAIWIEFQDGQKRSLIYKIVDGKIAETRQACKQTN